ncbi:S41 family peptidase [Paenibacillus ginsengarvi]|nr:S41 family peptidase [Paenibacillus ginsengarvi]
MEQTMPMEQKWFILSKVFQSIPLYFAHWEAALFRKEQLDEQYRELLAACIAADDEKSFTLLMMQFMAKLNNGHTGFFPNLKQRGEPLGLHATPVRDAWLVTRSMLDGVVCGDRVCLVDGRSPDNWYEELQAYIPVGNPESKRRQLFHMLALVLNRTYTLSIEDRSGRRIERRVEREQLGEAGGSSEGTTGKWIEEGQIAYIRIPSFGSTDYEGKALELLSSYEGAQALIVDVRGNGGGSTPSKLIHRLMDRPYRWYAEMTPLHIGIHTLQAVKGWNNQYYDSSVLMHRPYQQPDESAYTGRLVLLADRGTGSAAEDFVMPFKDTGRATIVGQATFGSTGQPFYYEFTNGMSFRISTKRAFLPDGSPFEGVGIAPDIELLPTRDDLYDDRDPVLEKALELCKLN